MAVSMLAQFEQSM